MSIKSKIKAFTGRQWAFIIAMALIVALGIVSAIIAIYASGLTIAGFIGKYAGWFLAAIIGIMVGGILWLYIKFRNRML